MSTAHSDAIRARQPDERLMHVRHVVKQHRLRWLEQHRDAQEADRPIAPALQVYAARRVESVKVPLVLVAAEERELADLEIRVELRAVPPAQRQPLQLWREPSLYGRTTAQLATAAGCLPFSRCSWRNPLRGAGRVRLKPSVVSHSPSTTLGASSIMST